MFTLSLRKQYFEAIKNGSKTVEGRVNSAKFQELKPGMIMQFALPESHETIPCIITGIYRYTSFEDMLKSEGVEQMLPGTQSLQEAIELYESFPGYKEEVKTQDALALRIRVQQ